MVFAFLCHSVFSTPCRVIFSSVYGDDLHLAADEYTPVDSLREVRKEQLMEIGCRVQAEYGFRMAAKDKVPRTREEFSFSSTPTNDEGSSEHGVFRLAAGDPFSTPKAVVWQVNDGCAFVLVCESEENRQLAESSLSLLVRLIREHITSHEQKNAEVMLKSEKVTAILHQFLPCGQLLFLNHKMIAQFEKQLEKLLTVK